MSLLLTLATGITLILVVSLMLLRLSSMAARQTATIIALVTLCIFTPVAALYQPGMDVVAIHLAVYMLTCVAFGLIMSSREQEDASPNRRDGKSLHWGPALIIGFFLCIVAIDAAFVMMAERGLPSSLMERLLPAPRQTDTVSSAFPGVVSHDFQKRKGLYNDYLQQVERQRVRGWQVKKGWLQKPRSGSPTVFQVAATTRAGSPLTQAQISGRFLRPSDSRMDTDFAMEEVQPGLYQARLSLPAAGTWNLVMHLRKGDDLHEIRASTSVLAP